jgi:hypothetical protein
MFRYYKSVPYDINHHSLDLDRLGHLYEYLGDADIHSEPFTKVACADYEVRQTRRYTEYTDKYEVYLKPTQHTTAKNKEKVFEIIVANNVPHSDAELTRELLWHVFHIISEDCCVKEDTTPS